MTQPIFKHSGLLIAAMCFFQTGVVAQPVDEKKEVLAVVQQYFDAIEKRDSIAFHNIFLKDAYNFYVQERDEVVLVGSQSPEDFNFSAERLVVEKMRNTGVVVRVHKRMAMVWAPYDLWVNEKFSHCGMNAFTLIKGTAGWRIASLSFTVEREGCDK